MNSFSIETVFVCNNELYSALSITVTHTLFPHFFPNEDKIICKYGIGFTLLLRDKNRTKEASHLKHKTSAWYLLGPECAS